jgi:propionyl-CoA carboxylase alpha chain
VSAIANLPQMDTDATMSQRAPTLPSPSAIRKILVANRGEIACRILRTCRRLDLRSVAVFSEEDRDAMHVEMADEAVAIGPAEATSSYLSIDRIVEAARRSGADAVHPGYGFLSENAAFAEALARAGLIFIGPSPEAMRLLGDKVSSKRLARQAGVSTVPGFAGEVGSHEEAMRVAREVGYPVMIKAAAGGGGKGMRIARNDDELEEGLARATSEATASFGDGRVFIERLIERPRHVEMQILADHYGNVLYLGERECSIQRRHQKVIEESPSPVVSEALRRQMGEQAVSLARAAGYRSAGTVEFMVDQEGVFYFLEVNTRLQVEHPVTEMVTGLDLVEQMIRIASGEALQFRQDDVERRGWALECRVYAEDPFKGFLPSFGRLVRYLPPEEDDCVRVDTGVMEGRRVSMHYDPMIAKVVTCGPNRAAAIERMQRALDAFFIEGVAHNISFLSAIMAHPRFQAGDLSTSFLTEEYPDGFHMRHVPADDPHLLTAVAAALHVRRQDRASRISGQLPGYGARVDENWIVLVNGEQHAVRVLPAEGEIGGYDVWLHGEKLSVRSDWDPFQPLFHCTINGRPVCVQVIREQLGYRLFHGGAMAQAMVFQPRAAELYGLMPVKETPDVSRYLLSPMPGRLLSLHVKEGDVVGRGQLLAIVEAMKMENVLRAERDGRVQRVLVRPGANLTLGQTILEFE